MRELLRATGVIARRDFTALVGSKAFLLYLLAPLLLVAIVIGTDKLDGGGGQPVAVSRIGLLLPSIEADRILGRRHELRDRYLIDDLPVLEAAHCSAREPASCLGRRGYQAILSGSIAHPVLTGSSNDVGRWRGRIALLVDLARHPEGGAGAPLGLRIVAVQAEDRQKPATDTAEAAQILVFTLSVLLSGMMLSNLAEEKSGKILEILAASVPIDAIFLGKLLAMLGVMLVAALLWAGAGMAFSVLFHPALPALAAPAMGWPAFLLLAALYFIMTYSLFGSLMLGIGSLAGTVREVQMLSLPITLVQLLLFVLAHSTVRALGQPSELAAAIFPFCSPFAMVARAAEQAVLWPHLIALIWQAVWVAITVRVGARLFRRNVIESRGPARFRWLRR